MQGYRLLYVFFEARIYIGNTKKLANLFFFAGVYGVDLKTEK
jgi:hypothetical protein